MAMQRIANPCISVRLRVPPPYSQYQFIQHMYIKAIVRLQSAYHYKTYDSSLKSLISEIKDSHLKPHPIEYTRLNQDHSD